MNSHVTRTLTNETQFNSSLLQLLKQIIFPFYQLSFSFSKKNSFIRLLWDNLQFFTLDTRQLHKAKSLSFQLHD